MPAVEFDSKVYQVPGKLSEFSRELFLRVLPFLFENDDRAMRTQLAMAMLPSAIRKRLDEISDEDLAGMVDRLTRFIDTPEKEIPIKSFRLGLTRYYLPRYERLSTIEAAKTQEFLQSWQKTRDGKFLDLAVATLCRPMRPWIRLAPWLKRFFPDWDGDIREKYNAEIVASRAGTFAGLPLQLKMAVLWNFSQMMILSKKQFKRVFQVQPDSKPGPLIDMVFHLAGSELGDYKSVSHTPFLTVLYLISKRLDQK